MCRTMRREKGKKRLARIRCCYQELVGKKKTCRKQERGVLVRDQVGETRGKREWGKGRSQTAEAEQTLRRGKKERKKKSRRKK